MNWTKLSDVISMIAIDKSFYKIIPVLWECYNVHWCKLYIWDDIQYTCSYSLLWASILSGPFEAGVLVTFSGVLTSISIPRAPILSQPLEAGEIAIFGSNSTSLRVLGTAVLSRPLQDGEMTAFSSSITSIAIPGAQVLLQPLQNFKLSVLGWFDPIVDLL